MSLTAEEEKIMNKLNKEVKRNDLKIVSVKEWGSPRSNSQLFKPQEYCEGGCYVPITQSNAWLKDTYTVTKKTIYTMKYIDVNGNGIADRGERFYIATGTSISSISNQYSSGAVMTYVRGVPQSNSAYANDGETSSNGYGYSYATGTNFHSTGQTFRVKIVDNTAYYLPTGTNAS